MKLKIYTGLIFLSLCFSCNTSNSTSSQTCSTPKVDYSCNLDTDCTIKDVGNCCGYYPECVNTNSPTDPKKVKECCLQNGQSSACGYPSITSCKCQNNRCAGIP